MIKSVFGIALLMLAINTNVAWSDERNVDPTDGSNPSFIKRDNKKSNNDSSLTSLEYMNNLIEELEDEIEKKEARRKKLLSLSYEVNVSNKQLNEVFESENVSLNDIEALKKRLHQLTMKKIQLLKGQ